jgi:XTP/dITP diphosphohydrolase
MRRSSDLFFASSNKHKYYEAKQILATFGIKLKFFKFNPIEIQSESISDIARKKALDAYKKAKRPIMVEDVGLFIERLGGFPGPYSSYVYKTIGNNGVSLLARGGRAKFLSVVALYDGKKMRLFEGIVHGHIAKKPKGDGWGYDPIFIPDGKKQTYAQIDDKNLLSHRFFALQNMARFYTRQSSAQ